MSIDNDSQSAPRLEDIQREYLDDLRHRVTPAHFRNVEQRLTRTLAALGAERVDDLQPLVVIRYRNQLRAGGLANRSANLVADNLRTMLAWASECRLLETNPLGRIRRLPDGAGYQRCVRRALSEDEIRQFLRAAEADDQGTAKTWETKGGGEKNHRRSAVRIPQAPLWRAFLETGARWSELTRAPWGDVDSVRRTLLLRAENTKARRRRVVPLGSRLIAVLKKLRALQARACSRTVTDADRVFLTPEGARWCRPTNNAMRIFNRILVRAGIPRVDAEGRKLDIHALRHTFGTRMARSGAGLVHVQRLLGHSDPKLTAQVYTHLDVEDLRGAIEGAIGP
jgi:integrase